MQAVCASLGLQGPKPSRYDPFMGSPNRIAELRTARGLTQAQLAEQCDCTHAQIQRLETGQRRLNDDMIWKLSGALRCHPGELFAQLPPPKDDPELAAIVERARRMDPKTREVWYKQGEALMPEPRRRGRSRSAISS